MGGQPLRFGEYELDPGNGELRRAGQIVELHARPLRLLHHLVEHRDRFVSKAELLDVGWPNTVVAESSLSVAIREVREALGDDGAQQRYIRTLKGRGFRYVAEVDYPNDHALANPQSPETRRGRRASWWAAGGAFLVSAALYAWVSSQRVSPSAPTSLMVLPLEDMSPAADHAYIARGMTEELIDRLAGVDGLEVMGRRSGDVALGTGWDIPRIGRKVGVSKVIEGSVRRSGERVRVTIQLINAANGFHEWSNTYERSFADVLELQEEIADSVAKALKLAINERRKPTDSPRAWEELQLGWASFHDDWREASIRRAINHFDRAIAIDPDFALPHSRRAQTLQSLCLLGYADCGVVLPRAWVAVERALELDPQLGTAHNTRGRLLEAQYDWARAEQAHRRAASLNGVNSYSLVSLLIATGRVEEGLEILDRTELERSVLNPYWMGAKARTQLLLGLDPESALELLEEVAVLQPDRLALRRDLFLAILRLGRDLNALQHLALEYPAVERDIRAAYSRAGWPAVYSVVLRNVKNEHGPCGDFDVAFLAFLKLELLDIAGTLDCLEQRFQENRLQTSLLFQAAPLWDPLRNQPRFQALMDQMNLTPWSGLRKPVPGTREAR